MATTVTSNLITDRENSQKQVDKHVHGGKKGIITSCATGGALTDNSVIVMCEIPVDAGIPSIRMWSDDLGTTGDVNLGFYPGNIDPDDIVVADAVDEDCLATAIDVNAAATANVEVRFEVKGHETIEDKAWEIAGLSSKPSYGTFFLAFTLSEATTAGGDITLSVEYI